MSEGRESNVYFKYYPTDASTSASVPGSVDGPQSQTLAFTECSHLTCGLNGMNNPSYLYFSNVTRILPDQERNTQLNSTRPFHKTVTKDIPESTQSATGVVSPARDSGDQQPGLGLAHAANYVDSDARNGDYFLSRQFRQIQNDQGYTAISLPIETQAGTFFTKFIVPMAGVLGLIFTTLVCFELLSRAFTLLADESICAIVDQRKFANSPLGDFMGGMFIAILLQSPSRVGSLWAVALKNSISTRDISKGINLVIGANVGACAALTLMSIAHVNDKARLRAAFSLAIMHCAFNWLTALVLFPLQIGTDFMNRLSDVLVNRFTFDQISVNKHSYFLPRLVQPVVNAITGIACHPFAEISAKNTVNNYSTIVSNHTNSNDFFEDGDLRSVLPVINAANYKEVLQLLGNGTVDGFSDSIDVSPEINKSFLSAKKEFSKLFSQTSLCQAGSKKLDYQYCSSSRAWILTVLTLVLLFIVTFALLVLLIKLRGALETRGHLCCHPSWLSKKSVVITLAIIGTIISGSSCVFLSIVMHLVGLKFLTDSNQIYQIVVGANLGGAIGNTLIALGQNPDIIHHALRFSFCHLMFNLAGFLMFGLLSGNQQRTGTQPSSSVQTGNQNVPTAPRSKRKHSELDSADNSGYVRSSTTVHEGVEYCGPFAGCLRIPKFLRKICNAPIAIAKLFGSWADSWAEKYRWFVLLCIVSSFYLVPFLLFGVAGAITIFGPMLMLCFPALLFSYCIFMTLLNSVNFVKLKRRFFKIAKTIMSKQFIS